MKVGRDYTWWVDYSYTYEWYVEEDGEWCEMKDGDACRFVCIKKHIKKCIKDVAEQELEGMKYRNLKVKINDCYMTTTDEL